MRWLALAVVIAAAPAWAVAQTSSHSHAHLRVFLDCSETVTCDSAYTRVAIGFVTYVRDPVAADVHVLLTAEPTGSGGQVTTARFMGRAALSGLADTLDVATNRGATDDEQRRAIVQLVSVGLVRFAARAGLVPDLTIGYAPIGSTAPRGGGPDPWHAWVFGLGIVGQASGQQYAQASVLQGSLTADHVTEGWKIDVAFADAYSASAVHVDSVQSTTIQRTLIGTAQVVKSMTAHWSAGFVSSASSSTFLNEELAAHFAPAVEYDLFPYAEATHHQLTFLYAIGGTYFRYDSRTIFDRLAETRPDQTLTVALGATEPWGSLTAALQAAAFVDDIRQNRQVLSGDFRVRLFSGLSLTVDPSVSSIHDQIYLPAGTASRDDILLARRQLATAYQYTVSVGLTFTFGSIFNGVVNPRFNRAMTAGTAYSPY